MWIHNSPAFTDVGLCWLFLSFGCRSFWVNRTSCCFGPPNTNKKQIPFSRAGTASSHVIDVFEGYQNALLLEHFGQLAGLMHGEEDVAAADKLLVDVELGDGGPMRVLFDP